MNQFKLEKRYVYFYVPGCWKLHLLIMFKCVRIHILEYELWSSYLIIALDKLLCIFNRYVLQPIDEHSINPIRHRKDIEHDFSNNTYSRPNPMLKIHSIGISHHWWVFSTLHLNINGCVPLYIIQYFCSFCQVFINKAV